MLSSIYIENVAVIEKTNVDFTDGFNVFTGETGAGKSIIIDAINAVLGERTSKDIIRSGSSRALISAVFCDLNDESKTRLAELGFSPDEDGCIILYREIHQNGKSVCRINGVPVNVSTLREVSSGLITIHGQHESYELMNDNAYICYLDNMGRLNGALSEYKNYYDEYKKARSLFLKTQSDESQRIGRIDYLRYRIKEIENADLRDDELEELESRRIILKNAESINQSLHNAAGLLKGDEES